MNEGNTQAAVWLLGASGATFLLAAFLFHHESRQRRNAKLQLIASLQAQAGTQAASPLGSSPTVSVHPFLHWLAGPQIWDPPRSFRQLGLMASVGGLLGCLAIIFVIGAPVIVGIFFGVVGAIALFAYLARDDQKEMGRRFVKLLPDALDNLVRNLQIGLPLDTAVARIAEQTPVPVCTIFAEVGQLLRTGFSLGDAICKLAIRINLPDFSFFSAALTIQNQSGGSFIEAAQHLAEMMRERQMATLRAQAASSQAKVTASILIALPILIVAGFSMVRPQYFAPLFRSQAGTNIMGYGVISFLLGIWFITRYLKRFTQV